jgi:glycine dehydrogenase subunit 2
MMRAFLAGHGDPRMYILIRDSAHRTIPACEVISGYELRPLKSNEQGCIDIFDLARAMDSDAAGLMLTNPNTLLRRRGLERKFPLRHGRRNDDEFRQQ